MGKEKNWPADAPPRQIKLENLVDAVKMRREFAKLDGHMRKKIREIELRADAEKRKN